jgi:hypothetical protein
MQAWVTNVTAKSSHTILRWRIKGTSLLRKTRKLACAFLRMTPGIGGALIVRFQVSVSSWLPPLPLGPSNPGRAMLFHEVVHVHQHGALGPEPFIHEYLSNVVASRTTVPSRWSVWLARRRTGTRRTRRCPSRWTTWLQNRARGA